MVYNHCQKLVRHLHLKMVVIIVTYLDQTLSILICYCDYHFLLGLRLPTMVDFNFSMIKYLVLHQFPLHSFLLLLDHIQNKQIFLIHLHQNFNSSLNLSPFCILLEINIIFVQFIINQNLYYRF